MDIVELREVVAGLTPAAEKWLLKRFGTANVFLHGYGYHNHNHGADVATAAEQIASELHEAGHVPQETVLLAPYAGWSHDAEQGKGHERRAAQIAAKSMHTRGVPEQHIATVTKMIEGTKVLGIKGHRIVQAADPNDLEQALLADADLSSLGRKGLHPMLLLGIEQQHLSGLITLPSPGDGTLVEPNREAALTFLRFHFELFNSHRYLLPVSRKLFPHQSENRDRLGKLIELYEADRITYRQMLIDAKRSAMS